MTDLEKEQLIEENARRIKQFEQLQESAMQLWQLYSAFVSVGFSEDQAFELILEVIVRGMGD